MQSNRGPYSITRTDVHLVIDNHQTKPIAVSVIAKSGVRHVPGMQCPFKVPFTFALK